MITSAEADVRDFKISCGFPRTSKRALDALFGAKVGWLLPAFAYATALFQLFNGNCWQPRPEEHPRRIQRTLNWHRADSGNPHWCRCCAVESFVLIL